MHLPITKLQSQGQIYLAWHLRTWVKPASMKQMPAMTQMKVPESIHPQWGQPQQLCLWSVQGICMKSSNPVLVQQTTESPEYSRPLQRRDCVWWIGTKSYLTHCLHFLLLISQSSNWFDLYGLCLIKSWKNTIIYL